MKTQHFMLQFCLLSMVNAMDNFSSLNRSTSALITAEEQRHPCDSATLREIEALKCGLANELTLIRDKIDNFVEEVHKAKSEVGLSKGLTGGVIGSTDTDNKICCCNFCGLY